MKPSTLYSGGKKLTDPIPGCWCIVRHGGRSTDTQRLVFFGNGEAVTRGHYAEIAKNLRQGYVRLYSPDGKVVERCSGPTLRTRW